ncbi:MAG: hypothetical protein VB100_08775 [Angelakisella sp.]|nr:hypothetical protein [Angelakisella sp.]
MDIYFEGFNQLAKTYKIFIFDDIDDIVKEKDFAEAFQHYLDDPNRNRMFMILIHTTGKILSPLTIPYRSVETKYQSIAEIKKAHPKRTGTEVVELFTLSGGVSEIINEFQDDFTIDDNLKKLISNKSDFTTFAWEVLSFHYRRPETYAFILHALALGNNRISEVGKFTGYPYNKCDKYIKSLIEIGLVKAVSNENKAAYEIPNPYFKICFQYIFPNQNLIATRAFFDKSFDTMLTDIRTTDVQTAFTTACFETVKR